MTSHLLASLLGGLLIAHTASAVCDVCGVRNDHTAKDYSTPFQEPLSEYPACQRYQQASCCDSKIVQNIAAGHDIYNSETETYDVAACDADPAVPRKVSAECKAFFEAEFCFYECDVNLSKYRRHATCDATEAGNSWEIYKVPIKASYCNSFFQACKDDFFCVDSQGGGTTWFDSAVVNGAGNCTLASGNCQTFADVYQNATGLCNTLFGDAFVYDATNEGLVMDFEAGQSNPNDKAHPNVVVAPPCPDHDVTEQGRAQACGNKAGFPEQDLKPCEACHLQNDHTEDLALKRTGLVGPCEKYEDNACCGAKVTADIQNRVGLYDAVYRWDRCYINHKSIMDSMKGDSELAAQFDRCDRWFKVQECFYECDVNAGKFRKHGDCGEGSEDGNSWQIESLPVRASECDAFWEDCKNMVMCTCVGDECTGDLQGKSLFGMAVEGVCSNSTQFCQRTVKEVWSTPKEWCELLWDNSFVYQQHEKAAYSLAWNDAVFTEVLGESMNPGNPNNRVLPNRAYPEPCASYDFAKDADGNALATEELCTADGVAVERMVANAANDTAAANTTAEAAAPSSALAAGTSVAVASAALLAVVQGL